MVQVNRIPKAKVAEQTPIKVLLEIEYALPNLACGVEPI